MPENVVKIIIDDGATNREDGMTRQEARQAIGRIISWPAMDARIDQTQTILERIGTYGVATISYTVEHRNDRFVTYKHISELSRET